MKTIVLKLKKCDDDLIRSLQKDYSVAFRQAYNNIELLKDPTFLSNLKIKSKKQLEYLQKEVIAFYDRNKANKERIIDNIKNLSQKPKLNLKQFRHLQYLKHSLNSNIVFGNKTELIKLSKGTGDINKWRESRLLPIVFYGETSRKGNRFFDFNGLSNGKILFKLESTDIKIELLFNPKKYKELGALEHMALNKEIPITLRLTSEKLYLTYDESILHNTNVDIKAFYETIKSVKDKSERKQLIVNHYRQHELRLKSGKLDRYIALDLNPDGIGYSVVDSKMDIISKGYYDTSKILSASKDRYELSVIIKNLFALIKHFKCHTMILEELDIKSKDNGNRVSNRKINNKWNRSLIKQLIERRCNEDGVILIYVNPVYSSFIGNLLHDEYDPVAASLEIARRGINKYSKGGFYPELDITKIINARQYGDLKGCKTWKDMYSLFITSRWSYRRKLNEFSFAGYNSGSSRSDVKLIRFNRKLYFN